MRWLKNLFRKDTDPEEATRHLAVGVALAQKQRYGEALLAYRRAREADPSYALAHLNEALALQDLYNAKTTLLEDAERHSHLEEIRDALERSLTLDDTMLVAWRALGHVSRRLGDYVRAEDAFSKVVTLAPEDFPHLEEAQRELTAVAARAERQRTLKSAYDAALSRDVDTAGLRDAVERVQPLLIHPETPDDAFWAAGVLLRRLDDAKAAREMFEACLERSPRHVRAHRELATLCMQGGDAHAALEHSVEAYREDPSNAALLCNVGVCHLTLGNFGQAEEFLRMAIGLAPTDPIVQRAWSAFEKARGEGPAPA